MRTFLVLYVNEERALTFENLWHSFDICVNVNEERALTFENLWHSFSPLAILAGEDLGPVRVFWPDGSFEPPYESCFPGITIVCYYCCLSLLFFF